MSRSSAEAEYRCMATTCCEIKWLIALLNDFHLSNITPAPLHCDNTSALHIAPNLVFHERTKHIDIDCHLVRSMLQQGLISTAHIATNSQLFTKASLASVFISFVQAASAKHFYHSQLEGGC